MALETRGRIEVNTLLAAMQSSAAFRAVAFELGVTRQGNSAVVTSGSNDVLDQARKLGTRYIDRKLRPCDRRLNMLPRRTAVRILITVLPDIFDLRPYLWIGSLKGLDTAKHAWPLGASS